MTEIEQLLVGIKDAVVDLYRRTQQADDHVVLSCINPSFQNMRIYRVHYLSPFALQKKEGFQNLRTDITLPVTGVYVAVQANQETGVVQLGYAVANDSNARGEIVAALQYGAHESQKAYKHILDYLVNQVIPVADGE